MTASNLFAYDRRGSVLAIADGREVLAHKGDDESPRWKASCRGLVVAIGATSDAVFAVEADGLLARWNAESGHPGGEPVKLNATPKGLAVASTGVCAVVLSDSVAMVSGGAVARSIRVANATAAAFSADGSKLAVGSGEGDVQVFSASEGAGSDPQGMINVGEAVRSLAWNAGGFWLVTGGDRVFRVEGDLSASSQVTRAGGMTPDCVTCSEDGSLFALRLDPATVVALAYPSRDTVATIQYVEKKAVGVAFGPPPFLGVGLSGGDGNKFNLISKNVHRTDTHAGRTHNRWMLSVSIEAATLPAAYVAKAQLARSKGPAPMATPEAKDRKGSPTLIIMLGVGLLLVLGVILVIALRN